MSLLPWSPLRTIFQTVYAENKNSVKFRSFCYCRGHVGFQAVRMIEKNATLFFLMFILSSNKIN